MINVLLVDDQASVRRGLQMCLSLEPDVAVVGEAGDGVEALELVLLLHPDVVLMDVEMPHMDGIAATRILGEVAPEVAVVILTLHNDSIIDARTFLAGAAAFVGKDEGVEVLLSSIRRAAQARQT